MVEPKEHVIFQGPNYGSSKLRHLSVTVRQTRIRCDITTHRGVVSQPHGGVEQTRQLVIQVNLSRQLDFYKSNYHLVQLKMKLSALIVAASVAGTGAFAPKPFLVGRQSKHTSSTVLLLENCVTRDLTH